ncbi:hypothetical protein JCM8097_007081 [Rhodosporidiobolus ruineniae]
MAPRTVAETPTWASLSNNIRQGWWWRDPGLRACNLTLIGGYDKSLMNNLQSLPSWQNMIDHPSSSALGLITCSMSIGTICSAPFFAWMSDRFGRRACMAAGAFLMFAGAVIQACANGRNAFLAGRIIIGLGVSGSLASGPLLVAEISHPRHRAVYGALYNTLWYVGSTVVAWLSFGTSYIPTGASWRIPCGGQAIPALFTLITIYWLPESPRWLIKNNREPEALHLLAKYHANGKEDDELVQFELSEIKEALAVEAAIPTKGFLSDWLDLFATKANRHRSFVTIWFVCGIDFCGTAITSYYLTKILNSVGVTDSHEQTAINGGLQVWQIITAVSGAMFAERLGRRKLWLTSFIGMLLVNIPFGVCSMLFTEHGNQSAGKAVIAMVFLYQGTYNLGCNPLPYLYVTEMWPLRHRAPAIGFEVALDATPSSPAAMGVLGQYTSPIAMDSLGWKCYFIYTALLVLWIVGIYFTFPETKGMTLEEIALLFGDSAPQVEALRIDAVTGGVTELNAGAAGKGDSGSDLKV